MNVAILPYEFHLTGKLADVPLVALNWPLGSGQRSGTIGDLGPEDHLIHYPRGQYFLDLRKGIKCKVSVMIAEPFAIHHTKYLVAIALQKRFHRIITHRPFMRRWTGNALVMPFGGSWVDPQLDPPLEKERNMSLIASAKRELKGHALRHAIAQWCAKQAIDIDLLGLAYLPIDRKEEGLAPYRYSVVIENCREEGYFTEKLIDCMLCNTVPIYWGAPDIAQYFDTDGMVICQTADALKQAIIDATPQAYKKRQQAIENNRKAALRFTNYERNAAEQLLKDAH